MAWAEAANYPLPSKVYNRILHMSVGFHLDKQKKPATFKIGVANLMNKY